MFTSGRGVSQPGTNQAHVQACHISCTISAVSARAGLHVFHISRVMRQHCLQRRGGVPVKKRASLGPQARLTLHKRTPLRFEPISLIFDVVSFEQ